MSRKLVTLILVILTGMAVGCQGGEPNLPSLKIEASEENLTTVPLQETVVTPVQQPAPSTTPVAVRSSVQATATPIDWQGGPDWAWGRAILAANGGNPFFDGWIGKCEELAAYSFGGGYLHQQCFFSDRTGQRIEFSYDGAYTYYVYFDPTDPNKLESYERITGSLLLPLKYCPTINHSNVEVTVHLVTPNGLEDFCSLWK